MIREDHLALSGKSASLFSSKGAESLLGLGSLRLLGCEYGFKRDYCMSFLWQLGRNDRRPTLRALFGWTEQLHPDLLYRTAADDGKSALWSKVTFRHA